MVMALSASPSAAMRSEILELARTNAAQLLKLAQTGETDQLRMLAWDLWASTGAARLQVLRDALIGDRREQSAGVRGHLARLIRTLAPKKAADILVQALILEHDSAARGLLLNELGLAGSVSDPTALVALVASLDEADLRKRVAQYLARHTLDDVGRARLRDAVFSQWKRLAKADQQRLLAAAGLAERDQWVGELTRQLRDTRVETSSRLDAIERLVRVSLSADKQLPAVRRSLTAAAEPGGALSIRLAAIDGLARIGGASQLLGELLASDRSPAVRARAASRVAANDRTQVGLLLEAVDNDNSPAVRASALLRLAGADKRSASVLSTVRRALAGVGQDQVQLAAGRSLAVLLRRRKEQIQGAGLKAIVRLAREGELSRTRLAAIDILSMLGDRQSQREIGRLARSSRDPKVRARASQMLALSRRGS